MGLDFIRAKNAKYVQKRDLSRTMLDVGDLLDRTDPERTRELFSAQLRDSETRLEPGYRGLVQFDSESTATLSVNGVVIGDLDASDAADIAKRMQANGKTSGMFQVFIHEAQDFSGGFKITPAEPKDIKENDESAEN
jgi:hypothetical protein